MMELHDDMMMVDTTNADDMMIVEATDNVNTPQWMNMPPELRNAVLHNLSEMDLAEYAMTSKQCNADSSSSWTNLCQRRTAVIQCRGNRLNENGESISMFGPSMHPLVGALLKIPATRPIFQSRFTRIRLEHASRLPKINNREAKPILKSLSLPGVTHLDLSSDPPTTTNTSITTAPSNNAKAPHIAPSIVRLWTQILPGLADLDLSYNQVGTATLADIARNAHSLTTLRVVGGILASSSVTLVDFDLRSSEENNGDNSNLRCLYLEDCRIAATPKEEEDVFQDEGRPEACPLSHILQNLERISLKGCRYYDVKREKEETLLANTSNQNNNQNNSIRGKPFTQLSLMKIVRQADKLTWFQSDLTDENVELLREEKPNVTFVQ